MIDQSCFPITGPSPYDGASESNARSLLIFPCNSRAEISRWTRRKLQQKSRALEASFTFITRLRSKFGRCVAGTGIFPRPVTLDPEWNTLAKALVERWGSNPAIYSIDGSRDMWGDQKLAAEELGAGDGEYFTALVRGKDTANLPMVQPLDPFEVDSPGLYFAQTSDAIPRYEDGVRTDRFLRPVGYSVRELPAPGDYRGTAPSDFREISAGSMLHLFRRRRSKQMRGIPPLYSGLNDAHDALDSLALEKASAKLHSLLAVAKTTKEHNKGRGVAGQIERILDTDGKVSRLDERMPRGAATVELEEGEALQLLTSGRPAPQFIEGMRLYCQLISLGADLPLSVGYSFAGLGGTPTRADLEDAQGTFGMLQDQIVWRHSQPIYVWRLAVAMETGELRRCQDPYWWAADWHGPAKITVDYGRTADANISLTRNGLLSHERYYEERGQDAYAEMRKQIAFMKWLRAECETAGVPIETIIEPTPGAVTNVSVNQPSNSDA